MTNFNQTCHPDGRPCSCTRGETQHGCRAPIEPHLHTLYPAAPSRIDCRGLMCHSPNCDSCHPVASPALRQVTLPEDQEERNAMKLFDGFMAYFPNAMAEVAKLSYAATQQHHPDQPMHWDRSKSTDHLNKIGRHMIDAGKLDDKGQRHSAALAWRAMANLQEELERDLGLPPSPASRNRPW